MTLANGISETAMVLAAGLGMRMRPLSDARPKCLLEVAGRATIDRVLDHLGAVGVDRVIVNLHYKGEMIRRHLSSRRDVDIQFSDEAEEILDTGGGVKKVVGAFDGEAFFAINAISLWLDAPGKITLTEMIDAFDPKRMDALLLLHPVAEAMGYDAPGDFIVSDDMRLVRRPAEGRAPYVYTGVQVLRSELFADCPEGPFSLNLLYDRAQAGDRLFGLVHHGQWLNLKTPEALAAAERTLGGQS